MWFLLFVTDFNSQCENVKLSVIGFCSVEFQQSSVAVEHGFLGKKTNKLFFLLQKLETIKKCLLLRG